MEKSIVAVYSYHHKNTEKIAIAMAEVLDAQLVTPQQTKTEEVDGCDLVGFGSGIYSGKHHASLLGLIDRLADSPGKKAFIFSTCGMPRTLLMGEGLRKHFRDSGHDNHASLRERLQSKGYVIVDEFSCPGLDTNSFLRWFGGINKGRPNAEDVKSAKEFAAGLKVDVKAPGPDRRRQNGEPCPL